MKYDTINVRTSGYVELKLISLKLCSFKIKQRLAWIFWIKTPECFLSMLLAEDGQYMSFITSLRWL